MQTVSILGCGWLGKPLANFLIKKGFKVKGSTTTLSKIEDLKDLKIQPFIVNISLDDNIEDFLNSEILIIAITSKDIEAFTRLISKIENSNIKKVIFISSTSVFGNLNKVMTEEDEVLETPLSKIEKLFRNNSNFKTTIIRFAGLFGGERHPSNWFLNGRKIPQPNGFVNMIHQEDCINIIEEIIQQDCFGEVFNACSNHHPTRKEFYTKAKLSKGFEIPEFVENEELLWKIISSEKVQKVLSYTFVYDDLLNI